MEQLLVSHEFATSTQIQIKQYCRLQQCQQQTPQEKMMTINWPSLSVVFGQQTSKEDGLAFLASHYCHASKRV
jgi:hypothetical protein